jgi:phosphopantetheine--protein transferase-like protein
MIAGVGTDILKIDRLGNFDDAFFEKVYTEYERAEAESRDVPINYYASRFAGKEAVYKCIGGGNIRLSEVEIRSDADGKPKVTLSGECMSVAIERGIKVIHLSLSYEDDYAIAFAVAEM